ncbi:helix-turn-helix domain-containing protein [Herbiconiux sp. P15]|uniref:helix-turn-helix domain-containing protein n=1 Tax=Herbiconiux liukaitaii TaxID=3342799 RepID=UPI0035B8653D
MTEDIGPRLRAARVAEGLSLRSVATALGLSPSLISQVETGKTQPSVSTLYAIASHLGLSFDDLMSARAGARAGAGAVAGAGAGASAGAGAAGGPGPGLADAARPAAGRAPRSLSEHRAASGDLVQRGIDNPVLEIENGVRWERLASSHDGFVDPMIVTYRPGASSSIEGRMTQHRGVEYAYLLSGELTVQVDFDTFVFRAGDSLMLDSVRPHLFSNRGDVPAKGIWFVVGRRRFLEQSPGILLESPPAGRLHSAVDVLQAMDRLA